MLLTQTTERKKALFRVTDTANGARFLISSREGHRNFHFPFPFPRLGAALFNSACGSKIGAPLHDLTRSCRRNARQCSALFTQTPPPLASSHFREFSFLCFRQASAAWTVRCACPNVPPRHTHNLLECSSKRVLSPSSSLLLPSFHLIIPV